ncbi:hypothetical protein AZI86_00300 [Bdellovibrio bacteriovorus]|uniref:GDYXXLXY protein n=1 Tax=Bdellovibrio bacteriovorus TaxID=959 RepID=A0A150WMF7_BDEBC|nr:GDYXXLXY domain-containing protein [Bdellovibrio bacteriovorus]KYG65556.1 hypothetical protein AZI86_00300 [Bdellovibrio bacteriovorus]
MKKLLLALAIPCLALLSMAAYHQTLIMTAPEHEFEIEGYDPRDLLSGHYLQFRIKYPTEIKCEYPQPAHMCVSPTVRLMTGNNFEGCRQWITGTCNYGVFSDNLTRFYIPADRAAILEAAVQKGRATVKVAVAQGNAVIKDLLIDGKSWQNIK